MSVITVPSTRASGMEPDDLRNAMERDFTVTCSRLAVARLRPSQMDSPVNRALVAECRVRIDAILDTYLGAQPCSERLPHGRSPLAHRVPRVDRRHGPRSGTARVGWALRRAGRARIRADAGVRPVVPGADRGSAGWAGAVVAGPETAKPAHSRLYAGLRPGNHRTRSSAPAHRLCSAGRTQRAVVSWPFPRRAGTGQPIPAALSMHRPLPIPTRGSP